MKEAKKQKGFTLIELLVVIAIIGVLATIVTASLNSARGKARDARRVADIQQLRVALQMYYDINLSYPAGLANLVPTYITVAPTDPGDSSAYRYCVSSTLGYHLGTRSTGLESANPALNSDADITSDGCSSGSFSGADPVYDVVP